MFSIAAGNSDGRRYVLLLVLVTVSGALLACALFWRYRRRIWLAKASRKDDVANQAAPSVEPIRPTTTHSRPVSTHKDRRDAKPSTSRKVKIVASRTNFPANDHTQHDENERLLPPRAATQPYYSAGRPHHTHADRANHGHSESRILPFRGMSSSLEIKDSEMLIYLIKFHWKCNE
ncbi:hypothetical protein DFH11DRAFT_1216262 [Phellopilus nigrolimitatus]|nr:hypothetical protein DFH11DRAFT_1216262 [Phellopilus nigrolimitatus]